MLGAADGAETYCDLTNTTSNLAALRDKVETVKALEPADFTAESWAEVQKALEQAEEVLNSVSATSLQIEEALTDLTEAVDGLEPAGPVKPTEPTPPSDPTKPTDATDPANPTNPSEQPTGTGEPANTTGTAAPPAPATGEDSNRLFLLMALAVGGAGVWG